MADLWARAKALGERLIATADGLSGADYIGATAISGWAGATVQAILESAKAYVDARSKVQMAHLFAGDHTATIDSYVIGIASGAGIVTLAGFHCAEGGADGTDALTLEGDILINGTTVFSTKPKRTKAAADNLGTFVAGTGITVGVINAAARTVALGDIITFVGTLTRTTPEDEVADVTAICEITYP